MTSLISYTENRAIGSTLAVLVKSGNQGLCILRWNRAPMRWWWIWLLCSSWAWAKRPQVVPAHHFCFSIPADFASPSPQQWVSPDGGIAITWTEMARIDTLEQWLKHCQANFPGKLSQPPFALTLGGQPAWCLSGEHQGRQQRLYLTLKQGHGALLVCSFVPVQSFAASSLLRDAESTFRWLEENP